MQTFPFFSSKGNTAWKEPLNGIWESGWRLRFDYTPIVYLYNCRYMCAYFECMFLERGFWTASEENDQRLVDVCDYTHKISTHNKGLKTAITPNPKHEKRLPSAIWTKEIPRGKFFSFGQKVPDLSSPHAGFWPFPWWEHWFYLTQMHRGQTSERTPERESPGETEWVIRAPGWLMYPEATQEGDRCGGLRNQDRLLTSARSPLPWLWLGQHAEEKSGDKTSACYNCSPEAASTDQCLWARWKYMFLEL